MDIRSKIILLSGPTGSGKSNFAVKMAKKIDGEIINADSMQVYKELKILTARPNLKEKNKIRHHLYGFLSVKRKFSTGHWLKLASKKIKEVQKRNKVPILVGGTGLYFKALTNGLVKIPKISKKKRETVSYLQKKLGQIIFYKRLLKLDPKIDQIIHPNDIQRSIRAYEVIKFTKKSLVDWYKNTKSKFIKEDFIKIYLDCPRDILIKRIKSRAQRMFPDGIKEVKKIKKFQIPKNNSSNKIIGINEIKNYLDKKVNKDQTVELIVIKTRQYAKRQATWARGQMRDWKIISTTHSNMLSNKLFN